MPMDAYKGLVCGVIKMAVDDYTYCTEHDFIVDGQPNAELLKGRYLIGINLAACDVPILSDFFWTGTLHKLMSDSDIRIHPTRILSRIEPGRWNEYLSKYLKIDVSLYE